MRRTLLMEVQMEALFGPVLGTLDISRYEDQFIVSIQPAVNTEPNHRRS